MGNTLVWSGFLLGLSMSAHCIGMCGPIAITLGIRNKDASRFAKNVLYNLGRTTTYAILGLVAGAIGMGFSWAGAHQYISILAGMILIFSVLIPGLLNPNFLQRFMGKWVIRLQSKLRNSFEKTSHIALFASGVLNGFLPCGAVYFALAAAMGTGNFLTGGSYMFLFGLGTMPAMFASFWFGNFIRPKQQKRLAKVLPLVTILVGILFVLRGLGLGIPFISPPTGVMGMEGGHH